MSRRRHTASPTFSLAGAALLMLGAAPVSHASGPECASTSAVHRPALPLSFEASAGGWLARARNQSILLRPDAIAFGIRAGNGMGPRDGEAVHATVPIEMRFLGGPRSGVIQPVGKPTSVNHHFVGSSRADWRVNVPAFGHLRYQSLYPGIDAEFYGREGRLEYDLVVAPSADPAAIQLQFEADTLALEGSGDLVFTRDGVTLRQHRPEAYEIVKGTRKSVAARYLLDGHRVSFDVGARTPGAALVIDPVISYSTFFGGSGSDSARAVALGTEGDLYVAGQAGSLDFPDPNHGDSSTGDAFVSKITPDGSQIAFTAFVGGSANDFANGVAVDSAGNVNLTGVTYSLNFPVVNPVQPWLGDCSFTCSGKGDAFIAKLSSSGTSIVYSTYLGSNGYDRGMAIAADSAGAAYVTGFSDGGIPSRGALANAYGVAGPFVVKLDAAGSLVYSGAVSRFQFPSYYGRYAEGLGIAVDAAGAAYVVGRTNDATFNTVNPLTGGCSRADYYAPYPFVSKVDPQGSAVIYSTCIGNLENEFVYPINPGSGAEAVAVDADGNVYVGGVTSAFSEIATPNGFQRSKKGPRDYWGNVVGWDGFVVKLAPDGGSVLFGTYLGGTGSDFVYGIALAPDGGIVVAGETTSTDFPTFNAVQAQHGAADPNVWGSASDAFVTRLSSAGSAITSSTFLGGGEYDAAFAVAVDPSGVASIVGATASTSFPVANAYQPNEAGSIDGFITKIDDGPACPPPIVETAAGTGDPGFSGDGGPATAAQLTSPGALAARPDGAVYVSDWGTARIRLITIDGRITTIAGTGEVGAGGDGGPAVQAQVNAVSGLAWSPDGSLYLSDASEHRVRRISPEGIITTIAGTGAAGFSGDGGPATAAQLNYPGQVAIGPSGSLYIADYGDGRVRRVTPAGTISTVAGNGGFNTGGDGGPATAAAVYPWRAAVGPDESLYIVDWDNNCIRRVTPDGIITTFAGDGLDGDAGDGGPATEAHIGHPEAAWVGPDGSVYISQDTGHRVRRVLPDGRITAVAGDGTQGDSGDGRSATKASFYYPDNAVGAADGRLYVADLANHRVRRVMVGVD